mmetsp:Transcript_8442/g.15111  ORF Transcript_8442/g.15111 Transcript_8442/m.15111 type:complete len:469 (-) Transcript_8442:34-1440(-)
MVQELSHLNPDSNIRHGPMLKSVSSGSPTTTLRFNMDQRTRAKNYTHPSLRNHLSRGDLAVPDTGGLDVLGDLGTQIGVRGLDGLEDTGNLTGLGVNLGDLEGDGADGTSNVLGVLLGQLLGIGSGGESNGVVVTSGGTTSLGVKEGGSTVGSDVELAKELTGVTGGGQVLDGEEERHTLTTGKLNGGGSVVNTVDLLDLPGAVTANSEVSADTVQSVGQTGHQLGLLEVGDRLAIRRRNLHLEAGGLQAHVVDLVVASTQVQLGLGRVGNDGAGVGQTSTLHLHVGQRLDLVVGQGSGAGSSSKGHGGGSNTGGAAHLAEDGLRVLTNGLVARGNLVAHGHEGGTSGGGSSEQSGGDPALGVGLRSLSVVLGLLNSLGLVGVLGGLGGVLVVVGGGHAHVGHRGVGDGRAGSDADGGRGVQGGRRGGRGDDSDGDTNGDGDDRNGGHNLGHGGLLGVHCADVENEKK